ncbi:MAG: RNA polymerase sigma factor SigJ [Myxococcota bacterium]
MERRTAARVCLVNAEGFTTHRPRLVGLAYRMLGSVAAAEDVVQETWLRWAAADRVDHPAAWLSTVCTRLCLDEAKSARARRETYVGPWLPEPWMGVAQPPGVLGESLTMAFLLLLQRLTPAQRAAWLLREVFDQDYPHIAEVLAIRQPAARQLVRRAREAVAAGRPRYEPDPEAHRAILAAFGVAAQTGDLESLERILADDVVLTSDGGGQATAALRPVHGASAVARFFVGLARKLPPDTSLAPAWVNGGPGAVTRRGDGGVESVLTIEVTDGRVQAVYVVRNPAKLARVCR